MAFHRGVLQIDAAREVKRIAAAIRAQVLGDWGRRGAVVGVSGGVDSATVLALAVRALGPGRVLALVLPDRDSSPSSEVLAGQVAAQYGVASVREDITAALEALGCYERRDVAVREMFPDYASCERIKIVLPGDLLERGGLNVYSLVRERPGVGEERRLLSVSAYLGIVAASNRRPAAHAAGDAQGFLRPGVGRERLALLQPPPPLAQHVPGGALFLQSAGGRTAGL